MIYTSYFAKYKGSKGVSVSRVTPKWYKGERCVDLAPDWSLVKGLKDGTLSEKQYRRMYIKQLKQLDVDYYAELLDGKVLLCYETPDKFCHRHIIREWFKRHGFEVEELE